MPIGFSVFKRRRNGKPAKRYTIELRLLDGTTRQRVGFTDRGATVQLAAQLVRDLERREVGLHDPFEGSRKAPIKDHVDAFLLAMENGTLSRRRRGRVSAEWVKRSKTRLLFMLRELRVRRLEHLDLNEAEKLLHSRIQAGWSARTRDHHAALLRQFGTWLVDDGRWQHNPFHRLGPISDDSTVTFRRLALTVEQLAALVEAAEVRGVQEYAKVNPRASSQRLDDLLFRGSERAVIYQVAAYTGLRRGEIMALRWGDLVAGNEPAFVLRPEITKNSKAARIELPLWLGQLLEQHRAACAGRTGRPPLQSSAMFLSSYRHLTERLKKDALYARIGSWDETESHVIAEDGKRIDFHALRGTCATLLAEKRMGLKQIEQHMRHSSAKLTMEVYMQARRDLMRADVDKLEPPRPVDRPVGEVPVIARSRQALPNDDSNRRSGT
jgi:integrase